MDTLDGLAFGTLEAELPDWQLSLEAAGKSRRTIQSYSESVLQLAAFLAEKGMPRQVDAIRREHVESWLRSLREAGRSEATVAVRYRSLKVFFGFLVDQELIAASPMRKMAAPKVADQLPQLPDMDTLRRLLRATEGKDFEAKRDRAILLALAGTGMRLGECAGIRLEDVAFVGGRPDTIEITGKGGSRRVVVVSRDMALALRAYLRLRQARPDARSPWLWLSHRRGQLEQSGIAQALGRRAEQAGIEGFHAHALRHLYAHRFLLAGGQENDLARLLGWRSTAMVRVYGRSLASERALEAARRWSPTDEL